MRVTRIVVATNVLIEVVAAAAVITLGCTTLGPMPATTAMPMVPAGRPAGEVVFGIVPGHYLSSGAQQSPQGAGLGQVSLLIEPDRLIGLPGLVVGGRHVGESNDGGYFEPLLGYRCHLDKDERFSASGVGYLTHATGSRDGASYEATRGGAEVGFDVRVTPRSRWVEVHASVSGALTGLSASGRYCLDPQGQYGVTCPDPPVRLTDASVSGLFPSGSAGISLDIARHLGGFFHGGRFALGVAGGTMPTAIGGQQQSANWYGSAGGTLMLGFGASSPSSRK